MRPGVVPATTLAAKILAFNPGIAPTVDRHGTSERMLIDAAAVALADAASGSRLLVVVDQFEEVFTLCRDPAEREVFLANLLYAATYPHGPVMIVVTMRADFYPRLAEFPAFAQLAQSHQVLVPSLGDSELRDVILEPAYAVGLMVEQGLADTILADVVREPGTLPLLEHALLETWRHRRGNMLTLEGYRATGGVRHALGERAEAVFAGLSDAGREQARHVFLRLIQPGEGTEDTRRRVAVSEITTSDDDAAEVIRQFVDAFLLTTSADEITNARRVEISHEAVITGWARCTQWVEEDRAGLLVHRRLTVAAEEWKRHGRSSDALYRGVPLAEALAWRARAPARLNRLEGDFLDAGSALERVHRRSRRRRVVTAFTALVIVALAVGAGVVAVLGQSEANVARAIATSRQLAAEANGALSADPALSLTLALRAEDLAPTTQAERALRQAMAESHGRSLITNPGGPIYGVRFLPDGRHAVSGSADGTVRVWDLAEGTLQKAFPLHRGRVFVVRASPDGQAVVSGGLDGTVRLTQLATGESRVLLAAATAVSSVQFNGRGDLLAASLGDGTVHLVDVATGHEDAVLRVADQIAYNLSFSADDALLAVAGGDGTGQIWRLADRTQVRVLRVRGAIFGIAFSPTAPQLATSDADGMIRIWDVNTGAPLREFPASTAPLFSVSYNPDGERLAAAGQDAGISVWTRSGFALATLRGHTGAVLDLDFDRTGNSLLSAGDDGTLRTWATPDDVHVRAPVTGATFDHTGTRIVAGGTDGHLREWRTDLIPVLDIADQAGRSQAVFSTDGSQIISYGDKIVNIRDAADGRLLTSFDPGVGVTRTVAPDPAAHRLVIGGDNGRVVIVNDHGATVDILSPEGSPVYCALFSPDGRSVLAGRNDGSLTLWGSDHQPVTIKPVDNRAVYDADFSTDGSLIASVDSSGSVDLRDRRGESIAALHGHVGPASAVRFSRDGQQLVSSGADGTVRLWDVRTADLLVTFPDTDGVVSFVDVDPDGTILKSAESQQAVRLLSCDVCGSRDAVLRLARSRAFRALTPDEERQYAAFN
jgi:WD40 repeat protein